MNLQQRMVNLQSWWVASELLRRHPELRLLEMSPDIGYADCLWISDNATPFDVLIALNNNGRIQIRSPLSGHFDPNKWHFSFPLAWATEFEQEDRRLVPACLEEAVGLRAPAQTPITTPKTLALRIVYHLLLFALNEPKNWAAQNGGINTRNGRSDFDTVRSAQRAKDSYHSLDDSGNCGIEDFWILLRGNQCLGMVQLDGSLHLPDTDPVDMMKVYNANKRDILPTAMEVRKLLIS